MNKDLDDRAGSDSDDSDADGGEGDRRNSCFEFQTVRKNLQPLVLSMLKKQYDLRKFETADEPPPPSDPPPQPQQQRSNSELYFEPSRATVANPEELGLTPFQLAQMAIAKKIQESEDPTPEVHTKRATFRRSQTSPLQLQSSPSMEAKDPPATTAPASVEAEDKARAGSEPKCIPRHRRLFGSTLFQKGAVAELPPNTVKAGYLEKQGGGKKLTKERLGRVFRKTWKRRWFQLSNTTLSYYSSQLENQTPLGVISLSSAVVHVSMSDSKSGIPALIITDNDRNLCMVAERKEEFVLWESAIESTIRALKSLRRFQKAVTKVIWLLRACSALRLKKQAFTEKQRLYASLFKEDLGGVHKQGWAHTKNKAVEDEGLIKSKWHKRWIILKRSYIFLFKGPSDVLPTQVVPIKDLAIQESTNLWFQYLRAYCFCLNSPQATVLVATPSASDSADWIMAVQAIIDSSVAAAGLPATGPTITSGPGLAVSSSAAAVSGSPLSVGGAGGGPAAGSPATPELPANPGSARALSALPILSPATNSGPRTTPLHCSSSDEGSDGSFPPHSDSVMATTFSAASALSSTFSPFGSLSTQPEVVPEHTSFTLSERDGDAPTAVSQHLHAGYLFARGDGGKRSRLRDFHRRYFVLTATDLLYFEDDQQTSLFGKLPLRDVQLNYESMRVRGGQDFCFSCHTSTKDVTLSASSAKERTTWITALTTAIHEELRTPSATRYGSDSNTLTRWFGRSQTCSSITTLLMKRHTGALHATPLFLKATPSASRADSTLARGFVLNGQSIDYISL